MDYFKKQLMKLNVLKTMIQSLIIIFIVLLVSDVIGENFNSFYNLVIVTAFLTVLINQYDVRNVFNPMVHTLPINKLDYFEMVAYNQLKRILISSLISLIVLFGLTVSLKLNGVDVFVIWVTFTATIIFSNYLDIGGRIITRAGSIQNGSYILGFIHSIFLGMYKRMTPLSAQYGFVLFYIVMLFVILYHYKKKFAGLLSQEDGTYGVYNKKTI